jgi:dimethylhistidine N-methyltransferase
MMSWTTACPVAQPPEAPPAKEFRLDVLRGLSRRDRALPCKYFYDPAGCRLFDRICTLPEYYLTRTELRILRQYGAEMGRLLGPDCLLIEYGSGNGLKTRLLLDHLISPAAYIPVDIAPEQLSESARALARDYPHINIRPLCIDFTRRFEIHGDGLAPRRRVVYFPGSTIGNFTPQQALELLRRSAYICGPGGGMLLGVDLKKDPKLIEAAYNDRQGVTAAFNLNLLTRINRELGADFRLDRFWHYAPYNPREGRVEAHLVSCSDQSVCVADSEFFFVEGESICTEYSYKYSLRDVRNLAEAAGFTLQHVWLDDLKRFSVQYLSVRETPG